MGKHYRCDWQTEWVGDVDEVREAEGVELKERQEDEGRKSWKGKADRG